MLYAAAAVVIGYQAATFSYFTKIFAINEGLLPEDPRLSRTFNYVTLESGLIVGMFLILLGISGSAYALTFWKSRSFGPLNAERMLRLVIPAALSLMLGSQTVLSSFFLSVLGLRIRRLARQ
jgi:hypothetical protein